MNDIKEKSALGDSVFSFSNKAVRILWGIVYNTLFRFSPTPFYGFRILILKIFGAKIGKGCAIYPDVKIWLPSNLFLGNGVALGPGVKVYNQAFIKVGSNAIISQGSHLCASTHDYNNSLHPLILAPIIIEDNVWICADAFVGPNVKVTEGCVVGARAVLNKSTKAWSVYAGNPAIKINNRDKF